MNQFKLAENGDESTAERQPRPRPSSSKLHRKYELIRHDRNNPKNATNVEQFHFDPLQCPNTVVSKSKLLDKFGEIRTSRVGNKGVAGECVREKIFLAGSETSSSGIDGQSYGEITPVKAASLLRRQTPPQNNRSRPNSGSNDCVQLPSFHPRDFTFPLKAKADLKKEVNEQKVESKGESKGEQNKLRKQKEMETAYWKAENIFISLIPMERNQNIIFDHPNILPVYGEIVLAGQRYVISDKFIKCSMRSLLTDFEPFDEHLAKKYLRQIASGVQAMHFHRVGHNRLSKDSILYNKDGQLFINVIKSTSRPLSQQEKASHLHLFAPELLFSKTSSKSLQSDIWAIGCLIIQMLTGDSLTLSPHHPYSCCYSQKLAPADLTVLDNVRQLYSESLKEEKNEGKQKNRKGKERQISESAADLIRRCLQLRSDLRLSIKDVLSHEFFDGA